MLEYFFTCPYCWQSISMLLDTSVASQQYIEDCEVCCRPIQIETIIENDQIIAFNAVSIEQ